MTAEGTRNPSSKHNLKTNINAILLLFEKEGEHSQNCRLGRCHISCHQSFKINYIVCGLLITTHIMINFSVSTLVLLHITRERERERERGILQNKATKYFTRIS
jgi:hypothetical protein